MFDFNNKIVLLTGATGGLGTAVAQAFHATGANLILVGRSLEKLVATFPDLNSDPHLLLAADVTAETAVHNLATTVAEKYGRVDVLANVAGGFRGGTAVHKTSKWVTPQNLANVILFLASEQATAVHGAAIPVYGLG